ncbi:hypothetical protein BDA99DRAFT_186030 [Phascolomyces articulosus]|uniref:Uncharacterized protein n=1 Tax=Phascolomyces articulosus TaxID=60185 RepID=A0AAD5JSX1_9FUNG|nr:hypothetical protein BDA99DRAFT_186030 [Phascolomyces articulosus]
MQYVTEQRIEQFRQEQFQELEKATTQAKCDRDFLWQKILEASRTVNEEKQLRKRLELDQHLENDSNSTSHVRFAPEEKNQNDSAASSYSHTLPQPPKQSATPSTSSFITPSSLRKSSFALDERVIATSWKKTNVPDHHLHNHNGLAIQENNKNENEDSELSDHDDESDGLFDLDEEIESEGEEEEKEKGTNIQTDPSLGSDKAKDKMVSSGSYLGSSLSTSVDWTKKRRKSNTKYLSTFEEDDDDDEPPNRSRFQDPSHVYMFINLKWIGIYATGYWG